MKVTRIISRVVLSLLLGIAAFAWAQQEEKQDHPAQQQNKHDQAKPEQQQSQHAQQQQKQEQNKQTQQHAQQQQKQNQNQQQATSNQNQNQNKQSQQSAQQQRGNRTSAQPGTAARPAERLAAASRSQLAVRPPRLGNNVAATTATASPTTVFVGTLVRTTDSASTACPSWLLADIHASSIRAIGSVSLTHGPNTGEMTGMTTTTSMSPTSTTAITFTTTGIPASELRSASRCNGVPRAASGEAAPLLNA